MRPKDLQRAGKLDGELEIRPGRAVLFVDSQGLGDVVQSLPLLRAVCQWAEGRWPVQALFATERHYEIVREESLNLIPFFISSVPRKPLSVVRLWSKLVGRADLIVCAPEMSASKLVWLKYAIGARYAIGEASAPFSRFLTASVETSWTRPWTETQDAIAAALGIPTSLAPPRVCLTEREVEWAESTLTRNFGAARICLGMQCASVVPQKSWPAKNFGRVVDEICRRYPQVCIVSFGTTGERLSAERARRIAGDIDWLEGAGEWSIRQTLAMLSRCDVFLSGDTGLMHMAAAVGTPTVAIFGPTSATRRAPMHNRGIAVCPTTACHPCFQGAWTPCDCIRSITPARVIEAVDQYISEVITSKTDDQSINVETLGACNV